MILLLPFIISSLQAASTPPLLDKIICTAWKNDPMISAQEARITAAQRDRIGRFLPNNPQILWSAADNSSWHTYGASLTVGMPGKAFALSSLDKAQLLAEERELGAKRNEIAGFILDIYDDCAAGEELEEVLEEAVEELGVLAETLDARYQMGQSTQGERIAMQLQVRQARIEQNALRDRTKVACDKLAQYMDKLPAGIIQPNQKPVLPDDFSDEVLQQMGQMGQNVLRFENDLRLAQVKADTAWWQNAAPDFNLGVYRNFYDRVVASPIVPNQNTWTYTVSVTLPLLYPFTSGNDVRRARAEATIAESRARKNLDRAQMEFANARASYQRATEVLKKLRTHDMPLAEVMVDSTFASYKGGKLGFAELLLAKRTWLDLKREDVQLRQTILGARLVCLNNCDKDQP